MAATPNVLFIFLDGVGLSPAGAQNPLSTNALAAFARLGGSAWTDALTETTGLRHTVRHLDANLGLDGLPQSGTGQASLFSGVNCAEVAGRHFGPYPHSTSKPILAERNLFHTPPARPDGTPSACFANAYPPRFFAHAEARGRWTGTTFCARAAGLQLNSTGDVVAGRALTADLTGALWRERLGLDIPLRAEHEAAAILTDLTDAHRLTLFEYYRTDKAGHSRKPERAASVLRSLDALFAALLGSLDPTRHLLLVTSDHGNLEDLGTKTHTRNPVPLIAWGAGADAFAECRALTDVVPALATLYSAPMSDASLSS